MLVAVTCVDVRTFVEEPRHHRQIAVAGGDVQERVAVQAHVEVSTKGEKGFTHLDGPASPLSGQASRGGHHGSADEVGSLLEQAPCSRDVFRAHGRPERVSAEITADDQKTHDAKRERADDGG